MGMMQFRQIGNSIEMPFIEGNTGTLEEVDQFLPKAQLAVVELSIGDILENCCTKRHDQRDDRRSVLPWNGNHQGRSGPRHVRVRRFHAPLSGCRSIMGNRQPGVFASLDPRLISVTPVGVGVV